MATTELPVEIPIDVAAPATPNGDIVEAVLAELRARLAALDPDGMKAAADASVARVAQEAAVVEATIRTITQCRAAFVYLTPQLAIETKWLDTLTAARKVLCDELMAMPRKLYDAREIGRRTNLELSIRCCDFGLSLDGRSLQTTRLGELLIAAGYQAGPTQPGQTFGPMPWYGSIGDTTKRIAALQLQLDEATHRLNDALATDEQRARQQADIAAKNLLPSRRTRGDGSQYDKFPDGRIVEVEVE